MAELSTVYRRAAELIDLHGWTQERYRDDSGCLCASGALAVAMGGRIVDDAEVDDVDFDSHAEYSAWREANAAVRDEVGQNIADWNDADGRTVDEVKALFLRLAEEADRG